VVPFSLLLSFGEAKESKVVRAKAQKLKEYKLTGESDESPSRHLTIAIKLI
jgi:hypothetical protein